MQNRSVKCLFKELIGRMFDLWHSRKNIRNGQEQRAQRLTFESGDPPVGWRAFHAKGWGSAVDISLSLQFLLGEVHGFVNCAHVHCRTKTKWPNHI